MKAIVVLWLFMTSFAACKANVQVDSISDKAEQLKRIYQKSKKDPNKRKYELNFFEEFPSNYKDFVALYGYENDTPSVLYNYSYDHIANFLGKMEAIEDSTYYDKIISISVGAHWEADAESFLQEIVRSCVLKDIGLTCRILGKYSDDEVLQFWKFYFDGPHPSKTVNAEVVRYLQDRKDLRMLEVIKAAHRSVVNEWKE